MTKNVLITGGTGLVGKAIIELLQSKGYNLAILSRTEKRGDVKMFLWDYEKKYIDKEAVEFADIIIHLAGENISSKRWTLKQKKRIVESRVETSDLLYNAVKKATNKPEKIISASAIGYYGTYTSDTIFTEDDKCGNDFLAQTVVKWEASVDQFHALNIPIVKLRIGVVMSRQGGALKEMIKPLKMGFASFLGKGNQYIPWIAIEDLASMFLFVIEQENESAVYNAVHPKSLTNKQLTFALAKEYKKFLMPLGVPAFFSQNSFWRDGFNSIRRESCFFQENPKTGFCF